MMITMGALMNLLNALNIDWSLVLVIGSAIVALICVVVLSIQAQKNTAYSDATLDQIEKLESDVQAMTSSIIGLGQRLLDVEKRLTRAVEKQSDLEYRDPGNLPYREASRLIGLGASVDDVMQVCGISRVEAELMAEIYKK